MKAALTELIKRRRLKREPTSAGEIRGYLLHSAQTLQDANLPGLSIAGRFEFAYTAVHAVALAALRANDLRPDAGPGHRAIVFNTLPDTIGVSDAVARSLNRYHTKRNKSEYGDWAEASSADAEDLYVLAYNLRVSLLNWLSENRPALLV